MTHEPHREARYRRAEGLESRDTNGLANRLRLMSKSTGCTFLRSLSGRVSPCISPAASPWRSLSDDMPGQECSSAPVAKVTVLWTAAAWLAGCNLPRFRVKGHCGDETRQASKRAWDGPSSTDQSCMTQVRWT